jgi:hypothetical protein
MQQLQRQRKGSAASSVNRSEPSGMVAGAEDHALPRGKVTSRGVADRGVIRAPGFSCDVAGPLEHGRGTTAIVHEHAKGAQPLQRLCDDPVHFPERGDADFQRAFVLCLDPAKVACGPVDIPEVLDILGSRTATSA